MVQPEFPSFKIGSRVRVLTKDYEQWLENIKGKEISIDEKVNKFKNKS